MKIQMHEEHAEILDKPSEPGEPVDASDSVETGEFDDIMPTHQEVEREAYLRYALSGYRDGRDLEDWFEAEQALLERRAEIAARLRT